MRTTWEILTIASSVAIRTSRRGRLWGGTVAAHALKAVREIRELRVKSLHTMSPRVQLLVSQRKLKVAAVLQVMVNRRKQWSSTWTLALS